MIEEKRVQEDIQSDKYICFTKVWGVTYSNRQEFVQKCQQGQELELEITISPVYSFGSDRAIAIYGTFDEYKGLKSRTQLGFLQCEIAEILIPNIQHGKEYQCFVEKVTGGSGNKSYFGLNIKIIGEPIEEYEDISTIQNRNKKLTVLIDGRYERMLLYEYYQYLDNVLNGMDAPNGNKQLKVFIDGRYEKMSLYKYYKYLDSVLNGMDVPIYIVNSHNGLTVTSEAKQLEVLIDGAYYEKMSLYEYYQYLDNAVNGMDAPNGNKQLKVFIDGRYKMMSLYEYYQYLDNLNVNVLHSMEVPSHIIEDYSGVTVTTEEEYYADIDNKIMDYNYEYDGDDGDDGDYYSEEDMW